MPMWEAARRLLNKYGHKTVVASDSPVAISEFASMMGGDVAVEALTTGRGRWPGERDARFEARGGPTPR